MGLSLRGQTSGAVDINAPAVAGDNTITLPDGNGSANQFYKNSTTAGIVTHSSMVENSSGNVGVGITNPGSYSSAARALVVGDPNSYSGMTIRTKGSGEYPEGSIYFADGDSGQSASRGRIVYDHNVNDLYFSTNVSERLRITSGGNIGIGLTIPGRQLTLSHASQAEIGLLSGADTSGGLIYQNASEQKVLIANRESDGHISFESGGVNERMRIDSSGNVGIGTNDPKAQVWRSGTAIDVFGGSGSVVGNLHIGANRGDGTQTVGSLVFYDNTQDANHRNISIIETNKTGSTSNQRGGEIIVYVKEDGEVSNSSVESATFTKDGIAFPSGKGIDFSATGNGSGTMSSELLDDYEEGTFTPSWGDGSSSHSSPSPTYSKQYGFYTKIGNTVYFSIELKTTAWNSAASGMWVHGLPYASANTQYQQCVSGLFCIEGVDSQDAISNLTGQIQQDKSLIQLYYSTPSTGNNYNSFSTANVSEDDDVNIRFNGFYFV